MPRARLLSTGDIASWLGVSKRTVTLWADNWQQSGGRHGIPAFKYPGTKLWRFNEDDVQRWLKAEDCSVPEKSEFTATVTAMRKTGSSG